MEKQKWLSFVAKKLINNPLAAGSTGLFDMVLVKGTQSIISTTKGHKIKISAALPKTLRALTVVMMKQKQKIAHWATPLNPCSILETVCWTSNDILLGQRRKKQECHPKK